MPAKAKKITETQEHKVIAGWYKKYGFLGNAIAFHIRNERGSAWERMEAARMGVLPKIPDWCILDGEGGCGFIEMKERGWRESQARYNPHEMGQVKLHGELLRGGYWVEICETLEEWLGTCQRHGIEIRTETLSTQRLKKGMTKFLSD